MTAFVNLDEPTLEESARPRIHYTPARNWMTR